MTEKKNRYAVTSIKIEWEKYKKIRDYCLYNNVTFYSIIAPYIDQLYEDLVGHWYENFEREKKRRLE